ncbi:MAG: hypothetical protein N4A49_11280 [Marinifilaceae bacterium]|jgi:hypothetical protein|nr:hypothetical protein [Marinifilaceae bacterium]
MQQQLNQQQNGQQLNQINIGNLANNPFFLQVINPNNPFLPQAVNANNPIEIQEIDEENKNNEKIEEE